MGGAPMQSKISGASVFLEQRARIVREVLEDHISPGDLSKKYKISAHCIRDWVKKAGHQLPTSYRPPAPPGAWAPPNTYSGYGAQHHQQVDRDFWHGFQNGLAKSYSGGYGQQGSYGGAGAHTSYHQQGQSSYGTMGGGGHHPAGSNNYYGNHTGGYTHAAQGPAPPASESPAYHPNGVASLATFNPYDISSYGGGKVRSAAPMPPRPTPY